MERVRGERRQWWEVRESTLSAGDCGDGWVVVVVETILWRGGATSLHRVSAALESLLPVTGL